MEVQCRNVNIFIFSILDQYTVEIKWMETFKSAWDCPLLTKTTCSISTCLQVWKSEWISLCV